MLVIGLPCTSCHNVFDSDDSVVACSVCGAVQHLDCWAKNKGCISGSCNGHPINSKLAAEPRRKIEPDIHVFCSLCGNSLSLRSSICSKCGQQNGFSRQSSDKSDDTKAKGSFQQEHDIENTDMRENDLGSNGNHSFTPSVNYQTESPVFRIIVAIVISFIAIHELITIRHIDYTKYLLANVVSCLLFSLPIFIIIVIIYFRKKASHKDTRSINTALSLVCYAGFLFGIMSWSGNNLSYLQTTTAGFLGFPYFISASITIVALLFTLWIIVESLLLLKIRRSKKNIRSIKYKRLFDMIMVASLFQSILTYILLYVSQLS